MSSGYLFKLAFGTGGRFGRLSDREALELVRFASISGITTFDTGVSYCKGRSQDLLYASISRLGLARQSFFICSKISASSLLKYDKSQIVCSLFSGFSRQIGYIDTLMLWGPSLEELRDSNVLALLRDLQSDGLVRRIGVNTHHAQVMDYLIDAADLGFIDDIMVDFNILQNGRAVVVGEFSRSRSYRKVWAGTALCQGFLLQSLLSMYLRTRSLSYVARALLNPPTRIYLEKASRIRRSMRDFFGDDWQRVPLSYALNNPSVSFVPLGMLSKASIASNIDIAKFPVDGSRVHSFINCLPETFFVNDVFS